MKSLKLKSTKHFKPLVMAMYALIFSTIGLIVFAIWAAPPATPAVYLELPTQTLPVNTTFTVALRENSGTVGVNSIQANMTYPAGLLDFVSIDATGSSFSIEAEAFQSSGVIRVARGNTTAVTGDRLVANITFRTRTTTGAAAVSFTSGTALVNASTNVDILGSLSAAFGGTYTVDATAPTVSVSAPTNGSTISVGSTVTVSALASDNSSISNVVILIDGTVRATLNSSPYNFSWNTTGVSLGSHTIQARASDPYGNTTTSATTTVTVADNTAPTVSISSPAAGSTLTGTATITATASDNTGGTGVNRVEFFIDGTLRSTDNVSPYTFALNSTTLTDGAHSFTARAYDNATPVNQATSAAVSLNVDNADHTAPTTPGNLTVTSRTLNSVTLTWTASTDNIGVTGYRVRRGTTVLTTTNSTTLTYTATGLSAGTNYTFDVSAVDANSNFSTPSSVSTSTIPMISGDVNSDGVVNIFDLSALLSVWGTTNNPSRDLNNNGVVDIFDLSILLTNWGRTS
jgi:chitodextrinase